MEGTLAEVPANATRFADEINPGAVYVNTSTRFIDGGQFGLGVEIPISTQKLHARGLTGLETLTTYKWIGISDGHVRREKKPPVGLAPAGGFSRRMSIIAQIRGR